MADAGHPLSSAAQSSGGSPAGAPVAGAAGAAALRTQGGAASRAAAGDFASLFHAHRDAIHRLLWRLTRNAADADDLLQETFLTAWRKQSQYDGRGSAEGWLRKTAFRLYLNQRTKSRRRQGLADAHALGRDGAVAPGQDAVDDREATAFLLRRIEEALDDLPDEPREAFVLFRFEGLTCAQIAETTQAPVKTVETRLRRATELLAERLRGLRDHLPGSPNP